MDSAVAVLISASCLGAYGLAYRYFRAPFFIFLSLAAGLLSCCAMASHFHAPAYLEAATDACVALAGALMAIAAWQLKFSFRLAGEGP